MSAAGPLRGPGKKEGGGFAAAHFRARRAGYGAAPPASRVLRIALRATALRAALDPGDPGGPWKQEEPAGQGLPRHPRGAQVPPWRAQPGTRTPGNTSELAFDSQKERQNYTNPL